jgi:uncharacterized protein YPO0396
MPRKKKQSLDGLTGKYDKICNRFADELLEMQNKTVKDVEEIKKTAEALNSSARVLALLKGEEGGTKMSHAKIKKIDSSAEEMPIEKLLRDLK